MLAVMTLNAASEGSGPLARYQSKVNLCVPNATTDCRSYRKVWEDLFIREIVDALNSYLWNSASKFHTTLAPAGYTSWQQLFDDVQFVPPNRAVLDALLAVLQSNPYLKWAMLGNASPQGGEGAPVQLVAAIRKHAPVQSFAAIQALISAIRASQQDPNHRALPTAFHHAALQTIVDLLNDPTLSPNVRYSLYSQLQTLGYAPAGPGWPSTAVDYLAQIMPGVTDLMAKLHGQAAPYQVPASTPYPSPAIDCNLFPDAPSCSPSNLPSPEPLPLPSPPPPPPSSPVPYQTVQQQPPVPPPAPHQAAIPGYQWQLTPTGWTLFPIPMHQESDNEKPAWFWPVVVGGGAVTILGLIAILASRNNPPPSYVSPSLFDSRRRWQRNQGV
jgi:hypothetical protein